MKLIDDVIKEPSVGAHRDKIGAAEAIKSYFLSAIKEIKKDKDYIAKRFDKIMAYGVFVEK